MKKPSLTLGQVLLSITIISTNIFASLACAETKPVGSANSPSATEAATATPAKPYTIVILGDSLTEGYGIPKEKAYPALLETKFHNAGISNVKIINAGISGSTSSSIPSRLGWILKTKPELIVLELGANDGLRGVSVDLMKKNLNDALVKIKAAGVEAILVGMRVPPNYGKKYSDDFEKAFVDLAKDHKVKLIPFLLLNTAGNKDLTQPDGLHPNEKGHIVISDYVFNELGELRAKLIRAYPPKKKLLTPEERRPKNE